MSSFNTPVAVPASKTAATSGSALKIFTTRTPGSVGYSICNTATGDSDKIFLQEVPAGTSAPTVATVTSLPTKILQAGESWTSGARDHTDIYIAAGSAHVAAVQELV